MSEGASVAMVERDRQVHSRTAAVGLLSWAVYVAVIEAAQAVTGAASPSFTVWVGSIITGTTDAAAAWMGWALLGAVVLGWAYLYRAALPWFPGSAWLRGPLYGLTVWMVSAGLLLPAVALANPLVVDRVLPGPGVLGSTFGGNAGISASLLAHLALGLTLAVAIPVGSPEERGDRRRNNV